MRVNYWGELNMEYPTLSEAIETRDNAINKANAFRHNNMEKPHAKENQVEVYDLAI